MSSPEQESLVTRAARAPFLPALTHIDQRFAVLSARLDAMHDRMTAQQAEICGQINYWGQRQDQMIQELRAHVMTAVQTATFAERLAEEIAGQIGDSGGGKSSGPALRSPALSAEMSQIDCLFAHDGPIGRSGLWFNPPVVLRREGAQFSVGEIHERIVEVPFAYRAMAAVPRGGRVLDVGSAESTVAFSLAALGFATTALEPRGYPLSHANLKVVTESVGRWAGPGDGSLDAVVCLSTLEHLGLPAYGAADQDADMDRRVMERFRSWLKPGGLLVLTAPFGRRAVSDFERTYDSAQMNELLAGWRVLERTVFARNGMTEWRPRAETDGEWQAGLRGVILVAAEKA